MSAKIDSACEPLNGLHWHEVYPCTEIPEFFVCLGMRRPKNNLLNLTRITRITGIAHAHIFSSGPWFVDFHGSIFFLFQN